MPSIEYELPASAGQRLLWLMNRYRGGAGAFNSHVLLRLRGPLDHDRLTRAVGALCLRHHALRTTLHRSGNQLVQKVHQPSEVPVYRKQLDVPVAKAGPVLADELGAPLDLTACPLTVTLFRRSTQDHVLCLKVHHLLTDGWSSAILARELCALHQGTIVLPEVPWQFANYVRWQQQQQLESRGFLDGHAKYWQRQLSGARLTSLAGASADRGDTRPADTTAIEWFELGPATSQALRELASRERTVLFPLLLAVFYAMLHYLTGERDLAVASMFANRTMPQVRGTVGFFANLLVLRAEVDPERGFRELLATTEKAFLGALKHQSLPIQVVPFPGPDGLRLGSPEIMFQLLAGELPTGSDMGVLRADRLPTPDGLGSRFDLEMIIIPEDGQLKGLLRFSTCRFSRAWITDFVTSYRTLAARFAAQPDLAVVRGKEDVIGLDFHSPLRGAAVGHDNFAVSNVPVASGWGLLRGCGGGAGAGRCKVVLACRPSSPFRYGPFEAAA